jgi:hypothetical protein
VSEPFNIGDRVQPLTEAAEFFGTVVEVQENGWVVVEFPENAAPGGALDKMLMEVLYGPDMKMSPRTTYSNPHNQLRRLARDGAIEETP